MERIDPRRDVVEEIGCALGDDVNVATDHQPGFLETGDERDAAGFDATDDAVRHLTAGHKLTRRFAVRGRVVVEIDVGDDGAGDAGLADGVEEPAVEMAGTGELGRRRDERQALPPLLPQALHRVLRHQVIVEVVEGMLLREFGAAVGDEGNVAIEEVLGARVLRRSVGEDQTVDLRALDEIADRVHRVGLVGVREDDEVVGGLVVDDLGNAGDDSALELGDREPAGSQALPRRPEPCSAFRR